MAKKIDILKAKNRLYPRLRFYTDEFVFDKVSGSFYRLSPVAGRLLKGISEGRENESLIRDIEKQYGVDRITILRDIELFLNSILAEGLYEVSSDRRS